MYKRLIASVLVCLLCISSFTAVQAGPDAAPDAAVQSEPAGDIVSSGAGADTDDDTADADEAVQSGTTEAAETTTAAETITEAETEETTSAAIMPIAETAAIDTEYVFDSKYELYVDNMDGDDTNSGTSADQALRYIEDAIDKARTMHSSAAPANGYIDVYVDQDNSACYFTEMCRKGNTIASEPYIHFYVNSAYGYDIHDSTYNKTITWTNLNIHDLSHNNNILNEDTWKSLNMQNCQFYGFKHGIDGLEGEDYTVQNASIKNCLFDSMETAVNLHDLGNVSISGCTFSNCTTGIYIIQDSLTGCTFNNCDTCIGTVYNQVEFSDITVNSADPDDDGVYTQKFVGAWYQIAGTTIFGNCTFNKCLLVFDEKTPQLQFNNCVFDGQHENVTDREYSGTLVNLMEGCEAHFNKCSFRNYYDAVIVNPSATEGRITKAFITGCDFSNFQHCLEVGNCHNRSGTQKSELHLEDADGIDNTVEKNYHCIHVSSHGWIYVNNLQFRDNTSGTVFHVAVNDEDCHLIFGLDMSKVKKLTGGTILVKLNMTTRNPAEYSPDVHNIDVTFQDDIQNFQNNFEVHWAIVGKNTADLPDDYTKYGIIHLSKNQSYDNVPLDKLHLRIQNELYPLTVKDNIAYPCAKINYTVSPEINKADYADKKYGTLDEFSWNMQTDDPNNYAAYKNKLTTGISDYLWDISADAQLNGLKQRIKQAETEWKQYFTDCWSGYRFDKLIYNETYKTTAEAGTTTAINDFSADTYDFLSHWMPDNKFLFQRLTITARPYFTPVPALSIVKQIDSAGQLVSANSARPGDEVDYTVTVKNTGGAAVDVTVEDQLAQNVSSVSGKAYSLQFVSADSGGTNDNNTVRWTIDSLGQNKSAVLKLKTRVVQDAA